MLLTFDIVCSTLFFLIVTCQTQSALPAGSACDPNSATGKCMDGLECAMTISNDYKCSIGFYGDCSSGNAVHCKPGFRCVNNKCYRRIGSSCPSQWLNSSGTRECDGPNSLCDLDLICRHKAHTPCIYDAYCTLGAFCDTTDADGRCMCIEGTKFWETGTCAIDLPPEKQQPTSVGAACKAGSARCLENAECDPASESCVCVKGFIVTERATCLPSASYECALTAGGKKELCAIGLVCDEPTKKCAIKLGYPCFHLETNRSFCQRDSVCDVSGLCKLKLNADCINSTLCKEGLVCSVIGKCRVPVEPSDGKQPGGCTSDDQCTPGARCDKTANGSGSCQCDTAIAVQGTDGQCYPKASTLGGMCSDTISCTVEHSECRMAFDKQTRCLCVQDYEWDEASSICRTSHIRPTESPIQPPIPIPSPRPTVRPRRQTTPTISLDPSISAKTSSGGVVRIVTGAVVTAALIGLTVIIVHLIRASKTQTNSGVIEQNPQL